MRTACCGIGVAVALATLLPARAPMRLDHNRMLVDAEVRATDGTWRSARLWVDSGNPEFLLSEAFARSLGFDVARRGEGGAPARLPHVAMRVAGVSLDLGDSAASVRPGVEPLWATMHADGNLPSTVLRRYHVVFDYPRRRIELSAPGRVTPRGVGVPARVHPSTGIVQVDADIGDERVSLAIDMGASYTFLSADRLATLAAPHADWPRMEGAAGCANIWGLWPQEERWPVLRVPLIRLGSTSIHGVGIVGLPAIFANGSDLGTWYSRKTAAPVAGFLGPNAFKGFRVEIDYQAGMIYLERQAADEVQDMDLVGLTIQPDAGRWRVVGSAVEGVEPGDVLLQVGDLRTSGATMGAVVDSLRGAPGDQRALTLERHARTLRIVARVRRLL